MKIRFSHAFSRQSGGALIGAMLVVAVSAMGFAVWTSTLVQRTASTEAYRGAMLRSLASQSSQQMYKNYLVHYAMTNPNGTLDSGGIAPPDNQKLAASGATQGGALVNWWANKAMESLDDRTVEFNPFSPSGAEKPYSKAFRGKIYYPIVRSYPSDSIPVNRSRDYLGVVYSKSPILGDYQLTLHKPSYTAPYNVTGNVEIDGGVLAFSANASMMGIKAKLRHFRELPAGYTPVAVATARVPSNMPLPSYTSGQINGAEDFAGQLDVIQPVDNGGNSIATRLNHPGPIRVITFGGNAPTVNGYAAAGYLLDTATGVLNVDLNSNRLEHLIITNHIAQINITGNPTGESKRTIALLYLQDGTTTRDLSVVNFIGTSNARRFMLCIRKAPAANTNGQNVNFAFANSNLSPNWRLVTVLERTPTTWQAAGGGGVISIKGGIQTNAALTFPGTGSRVDISKETNPLWLSRYASRIGWVETQIRDIP
jgi:hypothetical protein